MHHRTYARRGFEDLDDLTTLCQECHENFHNRMRSTDSMYEERRESNPLIGASSRGIIRSEEEIQLGMRKWEQYLVGMLLRNRELLPYVYGIVDEDDFANKDLLAVYKAFSTALSDAKNREKPIEQLIPSDLMLTASEALSIVNESFENLPVNVAAETKEIVSTATRMKRARIVRLSTKTQFLIRDATRAGDQETRRQLQQQLLELHRQLHIIDSTTHLQG